MRSMSAVRRWTWPIRVPGGIGRSARVIGSSGVIRDMLARCAATRCLTVRFQDDLVVKDRRAGSGTHSAGTLRARLERLDANSERAQSILESMRAARHAASSPTKTTLPVIRLDAPGKGMNVSKKLRTWLAL